MHPLTGPGYIVYISVLDNTYLKNTDIEFMDITAKNEQFSNRRMTSLSNNRECINYSKDLDGPKYQHLQQYKFLALGWCYDLGEPAGETQRNINHFHIIIANDWSGQEPTIRQEIDSLAEVFYKKLIVKFGKENVKMERRRTGPPF
ncbi:MAG: hypothetical protein ACYC57_11210 [Thermoleophilia bacterium]